MAAAVYVQEAANQVRNAIGALEDEIRSIQRDAYDREAKLKNEAEKERIEVEEDKMTDYGYRDNRNRDVQIEAHMAKLRQDADAKLRASQTLGMDAARTVQAKQGLINSLRQAASQLDRIAQAAR